MSGGLRAVKKSVPITVAPTPVIGKRKAVETLRPAEENDSSSDESEDNSIETVEIQGAQAFDAEQEIVKTINITPGQVSGLNRIIPLIENLQANKNGKNQKHLDLEVFQVYKEIYGHLRIPTEFNIPYEDEQWPEKYRGYALGKVVSQIRTCVKQNKPEFLVDDINELLTMGFVLDAHADKDERHLLAFQCFHAKYGHLNVQRKFVIASNDQTWPEEVRGIRLGDALHHIRSSNSFVKIRSQLIELGVNLHPQKMKLTNEQLLQTLTIYHQIHGHVNMSATYLVPQNQEYPEYSWGYNLGQSVFNIRKKGSFAEYRDQWEALGIFSEHAVVRSTKTVTFEEVLEAIQQFLAVNGHLDLPKNYIIPVSTSFSEHLHGIKLGQIIYSMRYSGTYSQHSEKLAELGIVLAKKIF